MSVLGFSFPLKTNLKHNCLNSIKWGGGLGVVALSLSGVSLLARKTGALALAQKVDSIAQLFWLGSLLLVYPPVIICGKAGWVPGGVAGAIAGIAVLPIIPSPKNNQSDEDKFALAFGVSLCSFIAGAILGSLWCAWRVLR